MKRRSKPWYDNKRNNRHDDQHDNQAEKDFQDRIIQMSNEISAINTKLGILFGEFGEVSILDRLTLHEKDIEILKAQKSWIGSFFAWLIATAIAIYAAFFK